MGKPSELSLVSDVALRVSGDESSVGGALMEVWVSETWTLGSR